ncbi:MAG: uracil phosphoribosyltransferase [Actinomycetota bacterium]|nr:uracil phosphoribosyltransferase [Actinomycetota bacterium]
MTAGVLVVEHPLVQHRLVALRDERTESAEFRKLVHDISTFVAYEALQDLATGRVRVRTPVGEAECTKITETVLLVPILRAGLGMVPAVQELLPYSEVAHVGLRRDEVTLRSDVYLDRVPRDLTGRRVVVCDPMLATGGSLTQVCDLVISRGASHVQALCVVASVPGIERFRAAHPELPVACAVIDPELDERGFIVPGLGDAGDRLFGPPA